MEACSLVAGFEYVLFFIPEMWRPDLILDLAQTSSRFLSDLELPIRGKKASFLGGSVGLL